MRKGTIGDFSKKLSFWHELIALCVLNPMVQVSYKSIDHRWSYDHFYALRYLHLFFGKYKFSVLIFMHLSK